MNGQDIGETPLVWNLSRKKSYLIEFEKEGCEGELIQLDNSISPIVFLNLVPFIVWGLLIGTIIDVMSGGGYNLEPDPAYTSLDCAEEAPQREAAPSANPLGDR